MPSVVRYTENTTPSPTMLYMGNIPMSSADKFALDKDLLRAQAKSNEPVSVGPLLASNLAAAPPSQRRPRRSRTPIEGDALLRRQSFQHTVSLEVPDVPTIPAHFLKTGRPASVASPVPSPADRGRPSPALLESTTTDLRPTTAPGVRLSRNATHSPFRRSCSSPGRRRDERRVEEAITTAQQTVPRGPTAFRNQALSQPDIKRSPSLPNTPARVDVHRADALSRLENRAPLDEALSRMARPSRSKNQDYFLDFAEDEMNDRDELRQLRLSESRTSHTSKRRSFPAGALADSSDRRPSTSQNINTTRPSSRFATNTGPTDLQRHIDHYRGTPHRASIHFGDSASISGLSASGVTRRFSVIPDRSPASPSRFHQRLASTEHGHRRQSFSSTASHTHPCDVEQSVSRTADFQEETPTENSEPKQTDSTSTESQTVDTVWDELDDLKSRIKKLEFNGKMPTTPSAVVSGELSDRPRTATTAPTTVDSSPKQERKRIAQETATSTPQSQQPNHIQPALAGTPSDAHPTLRAALVKAKPLLNATVFGTLEATVTDALQLSAMTSSTGTHSNSVSAASAANGPTVPDRLFRRKADAMCRNLTDLCLALSEGKYERPNVLTRSEVTINPSIFTSPQIEDDSTPHSPSLRHARDDISRRVSSSRPMSRLEARRSSILGLQTTRSFESVSPRGSVGDISSSELDATQVQSHTLRMQRVSQAPSNLRNRTQRSDAISGDEDPTIRPPSRAMTDVGALRMRPSRSTDNRSPVPQRTPSLRETLAARRTNDAAFENNRETPRMTSESRRRRLFDQQSTPPVFEEENSPSEFYSSSQSQRRINSSAQFSSSSRRATADFGRSSSLRQQRQVIVE